MVTARVRKALGWWVAHLGAAHEGVPLACRGLFPAAGEEGVVVLYSDASGGFGFGGWAAWGQKVFYVAGAWSSEERDGIHINVKELFAMAAALASLVPATVDAQVSCSCTRRGGRMTGLLGQGRAV